jgi:hypothetical protein
MKEVDELIYQRLKNDSGIMGHLSNQVGRIGYGFQLQAGLNSPQLRYTQAIGNPGRLTGDFARTLEYIYEFGVWSNSNVDVISRLKRLFDGHTFTISGTSEAGAVRSVFFWDGPDTYDEGLEIGRKDVQFKFFVIPKAQNPI